MAARESRDFRPAERAYDLNRDHLPVYVGEGLGNLEYKDAIDLSIIYRTALGLPKSFRTASMSACASTCARSSTSQAIRSSRS